MSGHRDTKLSEARRSFISSLQKIMSLNLADRKKQRWFFYTPANDGFWSGIENGLNTTNYVFDAPKIKPAHYIHSSLELDVKALRSDVRKAKAKFSYETSDAANQP